MAESRFLFGASTSAYQTEGYITNSDFYIQEHIPGNSYKEPSGIACDHYHRYEEDIKLLADAGLNAYRFSIEWARIQPEKDVWDEKEIRHYKDMITCCRENGVTPVVTMHHFSTPKWVIGAGGWESRELPGYFAKYCQRMAEELGDLIELVCTINEANTGVQMAALMADYAKRLGIDLKSKAGAGGSNPFLAARAAYQQRCREAFGCEGKPQGFLDVRTPDGDKIIQEAHCMARDAMKKVNPNLKIGLTLSLHDLQPVEGGEERAEEMWTRDFSHYLPAIAEDDFVGAQNYTRKIIGKDGEIVDPASLKTQMGYEYYPESVSNVIRRIAEDFRNDIYITENGIATLDDAQRVKFIETSVPCVLKAKEDGVNVKGYFYWSLLDNFEWQRGFEPHFGLIGVNRETMERSPKRSLYTLGSFAAANRE